MIDLLLIVWATLYTSLVIEAQATQMIARSAPPPKREVCCNYITKEDVKDIGGVHEERICCKEEGTHSKEQ